MKSASGSYPVLLISENVAPGGEPGVQFKPLIQPELVIVGRRGHPLARASSLQELVSTTWLVFNLPGSRGALERTFEALALPPPNALVHCESYATALGLIARSDLLGLVARQLVEEPPAERFLQRLHVREKISRPTMGIFARADAPLSPTAATMVQALGAAARSLAKRV